jgi:outer membrane protein OmpA-like peptidoglycan-associated protein
MRSLPLYVPLALFALAMTAASPLRAEDVSGRLGLGAEAAAMKLMGGERDYSDVNPNFALHLRYGLSPRFSVQAAAKALWSRPAVSAPGDEAGFAWKATQDLYTSVWQLRAELLYHLVPDRRVSPYLGFGLGMLGLRVKDMRDTGDFGGLFPGGPILEGYDTNGKLQPLDAVHFSLTFGAGCEWFIHPRFALALGARYHWFPGNELDNVGLSADDLFGPDHVDANTGLAELQLGFTWFFGSGDRDGDGIADSEDRCPEAAEDIDGFQDADGCPDPDNDGDGLPDDFDRCPESAEDIDGYQDADGCPDPDNDGDGIPDLKDACPGAAEDIDGFQDGDGCPDPDNDADGVPDVSDACPDTPAGVKVDLHGCPEVAAQAIAPVEPPAAPVAEIKASLVLKGVHFPNGRHELAPDSRTVLDDVARSLLAYPEVMVEIQGHTDSGGSAAYNESLSLRRAEAVRDYLVTQGVPLRRIRAVGYGERFPIASNSTPEGQAENRRVEVHRIGN